MIQQLDPANAVLATFHAARFYRRPDAPGILRLAHAGKYPWDVPVRLREDRTWFENRRMHGRLCGTEEQAVCQLVLWIRGLPRKGHAWWLGAVRHGLGGPGTIGLLEHHGYFDPTAIACVLCGREPVGWDWWCQGEGRDKVVGPCCTFGRDGCRKRTDGVPNSWGAK